MSYIKENVFQNFCKLSQKVQKLQKKVDTQPVTPAARKSLHKELENLQDSFALLRDRAFDTQKQVAKQFSQFDEMDHQIISLYRIIEEKFETHEISLISRKALDLGSSLEKGNISQKIAKQVDSLRHNILYLFKHRRPSLQHRKIVHLALKLTDHADQVLSTKGKTSKKQGQLIHLLKMLLKEASDQTKMMIGLEEADLVMDLYETADLFYEGKINEARFKLNLIRSKLSKAQARCLDSVEDDCDETIRILLEIADGDPCQEWEESHSKECVIYQLHA